MRTTISLPDHVLAQAKRRAAEEKLTLGEFVAAAVRERLLRGRATKKHQPFSLVTFGDGGLVAGRSWNQVRGMIEGDETNRLPAVAFSSIRE